MTDKATVEIMQELAAFSDGMLNGDARPRKTGFVILVFPFDKPVNARTNYVSNAARESMLVAMKEIVARFEGRVQESGSLQ